MNELLFWMISVCVGVWRSSAVCHSTRTTEAKATEVCAFVELFLAITSSYLQLKWLSSSHSLSPNWGSQFTHNLVCYLNGKWCTILTSTILLRYFSQFAILLPLSAECASKECAAKHPSLNYIFSMSFSFLFFFFFRCLLVTLNPS